MQSFLGTLKGRSAASARAARVLVRLFEIGVEGWSNGPHTLLERLERAGWLRTRSGRRPALGVIHILVSGRRQIPTVGTTRPMRADVLASACVDQHITRHHGQADCVVEFAMGEQPSIGGRHRTARPSGGGQERAEEHPIPIHPSGLL
jgi:hypothetical protein